jgi:mannose PTS system EIIC component
MSCWTVAETISVGQWLLLAVWAGAVTLDGTSLGQFMISRPLVACLVAGWIAGAPTEVVALAIMLEAAHLGVLPVGAARYPEGGPPAVAGGAAMALLPGAYASVLSVFVLVLAWEWFAGRSIGVLRDFNSRMLHTGSQGDWLRRHFVPAGLDLARGLTVAALALASIAWVAAVAVPLWLRFESHAQLLVVGATALMLAGAARLVGEHVRFWAAGLIAGLLLLVAL